MLRHLKPATDVQAGIYYQLDLHEMAGYCCLGWGGARARVCVCVGEGEASFRMINNFLPMFMSIINYFAPYF